MNSIYNSEEIDKLKDEFVKLRPCVPKELVTLLWNYWIECKPSNLLFDFPPEHELFENNIALILHAKAYGKNVPSQGDNGFLSELLKVHKGNFTPIKNPLLPTGIAFILSDHTLATLNSPIMKMWIYINDANEPERIIAIGKGVKELREKIFEHFLSTSLGIYGTHEDFLNNGIFHLEMPGNSAKMFLQPDDNIRLLGDIDGLGEKYEKMARHLMRDLRRSLNKIDQDTGLLDVQELHEKEFNRVRDKYEQLHLDSFDNEEIFIWNPKNSEDKIDACAFVPIRDIIDGRALGISIHEDLMWTSEYAKIFEEFKKSSFDRMVADLRARELFYKKRHKNLRRRKKKYEEATPEERVQMEMKTVELSYEFDDKFGIWKKLLRPEVKDTEDWFQEDVPKLLENLERWFYIFYDYRNALFNTAKRTDSPLRRICLSRFLDAVLRDEFIKISPEIEGAYEVWRNRIQHMLWFEFRSYLKKHDMEPENVFNQSTFFHTYIRPETQKNKEFLNIQINAFSLIFENESVVVLDNSKRFPQFLDPIQNENVSVEKIEDAELVWDKLEKIVKNQPVDKEQFLEEFKKSIIQNPSYIISKIFNKLIITPENENEALSLIKEEIEKKLTLSHNFTLALTAAVYSAFHSAREALDDYITEENMQNLTSVEKAKADILKVVIECFEKDSPLIDIKKVLNNEFLPNKNIENSIKSALDNDKPFTENWIKLIKEKDKYSIKNALSGLLRDQRHIDDILTDKHSYSIYLAMKSAFYAKLGRAFKNAAIKLPTSRADRENILENLGPIFEEAILNWLTDCPISDVEELLTILTGEERAIQ